MREERALVNCRTRILSVAGLVLLFAWALCVQPVRAQPEAEPAHWSTKTLVEFHQQHHPSLKAQDVYKLFYQSAFGVEHILADSAGVTAYLMNELSSIDTTIPGELVLERISLNGELVRVNLRPFKVLNLDPLLLVKVMFQSARETIPDTIVFYRLWNEFSALVKFGLLKSRFDDFKEWDASIANGGIQPVHHSPEYSGDNKPAYRVVRRKAFEAAFGKIKQ
jgi:hypothetical protein